MSLFSWLRGEPSESERQERWFQANRICKHPTGCRCHWCGLAAGLPPSEVPAQQLSDAGEDLVRLAAAKDAEIAGLQESVTDWHDNCLAEQDARIRAEKEIATLTEQRDILTARLEELVAFSEERDRWMKVVEAARAVMEWYDRDGSVGGISEPMEDLRAVLDAEAAAETAPSLPETP